MTLGPSILHSCYPQDGFFDRPLISKFSYNSQGKTTICYALDLLAPPLQEDVPTSEALYQKNVVAYMSQTNT